MKRLLAALAGKTSSQTGREAGEALVRNMRAIIAADPSRQDILARQMQARGADVRWLSAGATWTTQDGERLPLQLKSGWVKVYPPGSLFLSEPNVCVGRLGSLEADTYVSPECLLERKAPEPARKSAACEEPDTVHSMDGSVYHTLPCGQCTLCRKRNAETRRDASVPPPDLGGEAYKAARMSRMSRAEALSLARRVDPSFARWEPESLNYTEARSRLLEMSPTFDETMYAMISAATEKSYDYKKLAASEQWMPGDWRNR